MNILLKVDALRIVALQDCYSSLAVALAFFISYPEYSISPTNPLFHNFSQKSFNAMRISTKRAPQTMLQGTTNCVAA